MFDLLEGWLRHKSDMVNYEAARAICEMRNVTGSQLTRAISQLQLFLSSPKPTLKFAALRTLSALAVTHPAPVATCNLDMENLISDPNRSIATYAITTLLKVCFIPTLCPITDQLLDWKRGICRPTYETNHRLHVRNQRRIQGHRSRSHPIPLPQIPKQTILHAHLPLWRPP